MLPGSVRPLALVIIKKDNRILVCLGRDDVKNEDFYRLIGGGVEFGEKSSTAIIREIKEELAAELKDLKLLTVLENIFTFNGQAGHEICFIYEAAFVDETNYQRESYPILGSDKGAVAVWMEINQENLKKLFPVGLAELLSN